MAWFVFWLAGFVEKLTKPEPGKEKEAAVFYAPSSSGRKVWPRYKDFDTLAGQMVAHDRLGKDSALRRAVDKEAEDIHWGESLGITFAYIALLLAVSCW